MKMNFTTDNNEFTSDFEEEKSEIVTFDEQISGNEIASFNFDDNFNINDKNEIHFNNKCNEEEDIYIDNNFYDNNGEDNVKNIHFDNNSDGNEILQNKKDVYFNNEKVNQKISDTINSSIIPSISSSRIIPISKIHKNKFLNASGLTKNNNGASHIIDGEAPDSKRCYTLRKSTIRKISELKSIHPDINICISTIVDMAVDYYYACIMED